MVNILKGCAVLLVIALVIWLIIKVLIWFGSLFFGFMSWLFDTMFSQEAIDMYGSLLFVGAIVAVILFVAWVIGKSMGKK